MAGKVQMIYIDPPYGIKYGSNFQPFVNKRQVADGKDEDLTQEPEMIKAFRDTWELGIHSYLSSLRNRLLLARELLNETGSCFVQISDENVHHAKEIMSEMDTREDGYLVLNHVMVIENLLPSFRPYALYVYLKSGGQTRKHHSETSHGFYVVMKYVGSSSGGKNANGGYKKEPEYLPSHTAQKHLENFCR